jgi:hypothetical protein
MPSFPVLSAGVSVHLPWTRETVFRNAHAEQNHGGRYSYNERALPLMRWTMSPSSLPDADIATLRNFFLARGGAYEAFDFTDPETLVTHAKCRFAMESLDVRHTGPDENAVTIVIEEYA